MFKKKLLAILLPAMVMFMGIYLTSCDGEENGNDCITEESLIGDYAGGHVLNFPAGIRDLLETFLGDTVDLSEPFEDTLNVTNPVSGDDELSVYSNLLDVTILVEINGCNRLRVPSQNFPLIELTEGVAVENATISGSATVSETGVITLNLNVQGSIDGSPINPITAPVKGDFAEI